MSYKPDPRLVGAYEEATQLDENGLRGMCPSYIELVEEDSRFREETLLGKGAVKEVYKVFNSHTRRWVAMARLREDRGPEFYDLFVHEAWLTASLSHSNIITVYDVGIGEDGRPFFTMDLKGQSTLAERISGPKAAGRLELLDVFMKVCDAVAYAHSRGVIHLDLKPDNIQADAYGEVLVCDWGLAKAMGETEEGEADMPFALRPDRDMTLTGQIKGSPGYMAPEQVVSGGKKDTRSDIFALGCILHLILTGQPAFRGTLEEIIELTKRSAIGSLRKNYPDRNIPEALEAVVLKATAQNPDDRYDSVNTLKDDISRFLGGFSTLAERPGFFREARLFVARNRIPFAISLISVVALSVLGLLSVQAIHRQHDRAVLFEAKAETLEALYQDEVDHSEAQRGKLAGNLAASVSKLKKVGIFHRPLATVREARNLVDGALALNAKSANVRLQRFSLNCITLDFASALQDPVYKGSALQDYLLYAEAFPAFAFSEDHRPTVSQLAGFLYRAYALNPKRQALMERIVAYDYAAREHTEDYAPVVRALMAFVNGLSEDNALELEYQPGESLLLLRSPEKVRLAIWDEWASQECLLRFIPARSLKVEIKGAFHLGDCQGLQIEALDLTECGTLILSDHVRLPLLRRIIIRPGQVELGKLRDVIQSNDRLVIVEKSAE
jgi:serine/threonine protein kinase